MCTNVENEKSESTTTANSVSGGICDKNHWVHLFSDSDVNVECVLTEQLLQIRKSLKGSFKGCDIYKPKKPKGLATMVLDEWKRYYPDSEETNKTIGMYMFNAHTKCTFKTCHLCYKHAIYPKSILHALTTYNIKPETCTYVEKCNNFCWI